jgi:hypothetical protein
VSCVRHNVNLVLNSDLWVTYLSRRFGPLVFLTWGVGSQGHHLGHHCVLNHSRLPRVSASCLAAPFSERNAYVLHTIKAELELNITKMTTHHNHDDHNFSKMVETSKKVKGERLLRHHLLFDGNYPIQDRIPGRFSDLYHRVHGCTTYVTFPAIESYHTYALGRAPLIREPSPSTVSMSGKGMGMLTLSRDFLPNHY